MKKKILRGLIFLVETDHLEESRLEDTLKTEFDWVDWDVIRIRFPENMISFGDSNKTVGQI
jgi:hypothetical protein